MAPPCCQVCAKQMSILKRCTQCHQAFYCSRDCQVIDWASHKTTCVRKERLSHSTQDVATSDIKSRPRGGSGNCAPGGATDKVPATRSRNKSIWGSECVKNIGKGRNKQAKDGQPIRKAGKITCAFTPRSDSEGSVARHDELHQKNKVAAIERDEHGDAVSKTYLCRDVLRSDVPVLDPLLPHTEITVKANRERYKIQVDSAWGWEDVSKLVSHRTEIPLDKLKLIAKGKIIIGTDLFWALASQPKVVFQAIGERRESADGLEGIEVVMQQLSVDRNNAIRALRRSKGDVVDAMLDLGSR